MTTTTTRSEPRSSGEPTRLAQIVAVVAGTKTRTERALTDAHHQAQKSVYFAGLTRTYRPRDEEGEHLPPESTPVQMRAADIIASVTEAMARMLDVVAIQDYANTQAKADLVVEGQTLLLDAPVTYLMWLEKQVVSLRTFVSKLPVLDISQDWTFDLDTRSYRAPAVETYRTKKVMRNHVRSEATDRHPAQVDVYTEDQVVGYWSKIDFSGAMPPAQVFEISRRLDSLLDAIRFAREQANTTLVGNASVGGPILEWIFRG